MMKQRTKPGAARRSITALAAGLALLLSGSSMPSDPDGSLPPLSGASANLWGALAIDSNQGPSWGWAVDYETVQAASQSALARCEVQSCQVVMTFTNQCGAFAADQARGSTIYGWAKTSSSNSARNMALDYCRQRGGTSCIVRVWGCTSSPLDS